MEQDENEGLERLAAAALARTAETIADIFETTEEDGPAKLLLSALTLVVKFSLREHDRVVTIGRDHRPPDNISDSTSLYVTKPTTTDGLPKLAVWAYDHTGDTGEVPGDRHAPSQVCLQERGRRHPGAGPGPYH
ncbi:hypothetical protein [Bradyrhizobium sp. USDA 4520]